MFKQIIQEKKDGNETGYWTKQRMGPHGWTMLHLIATKLPSKLTIEEQNKYKIFMHLFAQFYPCKDCSEHFQQLLKDNPMNVTTRLEGIQYICKAHNLVNLRLGKSQFPCEGDAIFDKWGGKESCGCNDKSNITEVHQPEVQKIVTNEWEQKNMEISRVPILHEDVLKQKRKVPNQKTNVWV